MSEPKRIEEITVEDLSSNRWCYFHDDQGGYDCFEWVIPDTHPEFSEEIMEMELATFRFRGGEEYKGMFDGTKCFTVYLAGEWHSFWRGGFPPSESDTVNFKAVLSELGLMLPVVATARWSGKVDQYNGLRYYDQDQNEVEV